MKKTLITTMILFTCVASNFSSKAQGNGSVTANITVTLADVLDIHIASAVGNNTNVPAFAFNTPAAYQNGVQQALADHLFVVASKAFQIKVAIGADLNDGNGNLIPAAAVTVLAADGSSGNSGKPAGTTYAPAVALSTTATQILTTTGGTALYKFNVTYTAGGGSNASHFLGKPNGNYTATVTYTIEP